MENTMNTAKRTHPELTETRATIYFRGGMGRIERLEVRAYSVELAPWAQYSAAVHVRFIKKGSRRVAGFVQSYDPSLVVVEGWDHPETLPTFTPFVPSGEGVTVSRGRHLTCSPEWDTEFAATLATSGAKVLHDYRGHNPHRALAAEVA